MARTNDPLFEQHVNLLHILFDRMPMGIAILDQRLRLVRYNPTWAEFVERYIPSRTCQIAPGAYFFDVVPGVENVLKPLFDACLQGETVWRDGVRLESAGMASYWDQVYSPLVKDGQVVGIVDVSIDATERVEAYRTLERRVEERTREIERRRVVAEGLRDILNVLNSERPLDEILTYIVAQACRLLGTDTGAIYRLHPEENLLRIQAAQGLSAEYVRQVSIPVGEGVVGRAMKTHQPVAIRDMLEFFSEDDVLFSDPARRQQLQQLGAKYRAILAVPLIIKNDVYGGITLYYARPRRFTADDIELARTVGDQVALALENARLRSQAQEAAVAAERSRLARDLHDSVTQTLFSASLIAEVLPRLWERNNDEGRRRLEELRQLARGALAEMRTLLLELRPAALVEGELSELLRQLVEAAAGRARVPVQLQVIDAADQKVALPGDVQIVFYRVAQEAINNIAKHSRATKAEVILRYAKNSLELHISDNGQGFDPGAVDADHMGLRIIRERAESIGAACRITSAVGEGTQISLIWQGVGAA